MSLLTNWLMGHDEVTLTTKQRSTHTYVVGQSGTGKSRAVESWVMQDILAGHGVGVIDPHGDLYNHLVARIAKHPELWQKVILLNPVDPDWVVGFNPLATIDQISAERLAMHMTDVSAKVWHLDSTKAPRMVWLLTNTFLALVALNLTLLDMPRFLIDRGFREGLINRIPLPSVRQYFESEFPENDKGAHQWIAPVLNKMGGLMFDPDIRLIFAGQSSMDFRKIMDDQMILLVNLSKGIIGEGMSALLAAFIVAHIQKTALARANSNHRPPFYFYLDEFQNYTTDNIIDILSESRKYALSLTLAHQFLDQLPGKLQSAVLNTSGTIASFRVGYHDARILSKEIFPAPDFIQKFAFKPTYRFPRLDDIGWDGLARELASLQQRQFWYRRRGQFQPIKQHTFYMPDPKYTPGLKQQIKALRDFSGQRFGRPKHTVQQQAPKSMNKTNNIPLWTE
jgi:hypothetical protein